MIGEGKKKERGRNINVWLPLTHLPWGPGMQPRHVPWLGIEQRPFGSQAPSQSTELHQPGLFIVSFWFK